PGGTVHGRLPVVHSFRPGERDTGQAYQPRRHSVDIQPHGLIPRAMMTALTRIARALTLGAALALPLAALAPLATAPARAADAGSDLSAVNRTIRAITTLSADFTQTDRNGGVSNGKLLLKQPGHI